MTQSAFKIAISAGELSGDEHAAALVSALKLLAPGATFRGMGGHKLRECGVDTIVDSEQSASVMGFIDVALSFRKILGAFRTIEKLLNEWRPDLLILVDYPDFNLRLAKVAHRLGIKVFYFIPPSVWAWRSGRVELLKEYVDHIATIFPFERAFLQSAGYQTATYVGHPFVDELDTEHVGDPSRRSFLTMFGLDPNKPVLAIFPGSRPSEIDRYLPGMLAGVSILQKRHPEVQGIVGVAPSIGKAKIEPYLQGTSQIIAAKENPLQLMKVADAGLLKSGTSNLQAAFLSLPFVMFYKVPVWTEIIAKMLIKPKEYSIVNVLKSRTVVELTQRQTDASNVAEKLELVLFDEGIRNNIKENFKQIVDELRTFDQSDKFAGDGNAYQRTAILARDCLVSRLSLTTPILKRPTLNSSSK